jgi:hypothetical protein
MLLKFNDNVEIEASYVNGQAGIFRERSGTL